MQTDRYTEAMSELSNRYQQILKLLKNNNDKIKGSELRRELAKIQRKIRRGMDFEYEGTLSSKPKQPLA